MGTGIVYRKGEHFDGTQLQYIQEEPRQTKKVRRALFLCTCGGTVVCNISDVRHLNTTSCGCYRSEQVTEKNTIHSHAVRGETTGTYRTWQAMHQRVTSDPHYKDISICERWFSYENFLEDMGERPDKHTIERTVNLGNYEPSNCKWATRSEQAQNTKTTVRVTINGETHSINEWCRIKGIGYHVVKQRRARGMSVEDAITTPINTTKQGRRYV